MLSYHWRGYLQNAVFYYCSIIAVPEAWYNTMVSRSLEPIAAHEHTDEVTLFCVYHLVDISCTVQAVNGLAWTKQYQTANQLVDAVQQDIILKVTGLASHLKLDSTCRFLIHVSLYQSERKADCIQWLEMYKIHFFILIFLLVSICMHVCVHTRTKHSCIEIAHDQLLITPYCKNVIGLYLYRRKKW